MSSLNGFAVMGDYINGGDTSVVDNVSMRAQASPPATTSTFPTDTENWSAISCNLSGDPTVRPYATTFSASGGNPGGAVQVSDLDNQYSYAMAPMRYFGGNYLLFAGGEVSYDVKISFTGSSVLSLPVPYVVLTGGGQSAYYLPEIVPPFAPTVYRTVRAPLIASRHWRFGSPTGPAATPAQFSQLLKYVDGIRVRTEFVLGTDTGFVDNFAILPSAGETIVSGSVNLGSEFVGNPSGTAVALAVFKDGWPMGEYAGALDSLGQYSISIPVRGVVTLAIKPSHWLRSAPSAQVLANGTPLTANFVTLNGDVDGDNEVTILDYLVISKYFEKASDDPAWLTADAEGMRPVDADIDADGTVSILDYLIVSANYGLAGTEA
jgi:hypothetical protein